MRRVLTLAHVAILLGSAVCLCPVRLWAAAQAEKNGDLIVMQNSLLRLVIDLKKGGRIAEFFYQPFAENIVYPAESCGGLLMDHVWEQTWPGEFLNRAYEGEIVKNGPEEAIVKLATIGVGETIKGIRLERCIAIKDNDRAVYCTVSLINTADTGRVTGYWSQNNYWFGGKKEGMTWARPAVRGIDRLGRNEKGEEWFSGAWYYIDDATAGWNAGYNRELRRGMMFLMDYNDLWRLYDNAVAITTEWMYDRVAIPAGKTWRTEIIFFPVSGITGFVHGSKYATANCEVEIKGETLALTHQLAKGIVPLKNVKLTTKVWGLKKPWEIIMPEATFAELKDEAQTAVVQAAGIGAMPMGIQVTLSGVTPDGQPVAETYGDYFGGAEGKNNDPFTMKPYLAFARKPKQKVYLKPDIIKYTANAEPRVLYLRGLWTDFFRADEAVKAALPGASITDGWLDSSPVGLTLSYFPADYEALTSYDLYILGNVPAAPLDLVGQEMLKDYLLAGGNLLMLGGDHAFGQANFSNADLIELLPIELGSAYNWRKCAAGHLKIAAEHPVTKGIAFGERDMVFYSHLCKPRQNAIVAVTAGEWPILVLAETPKAGRIACVLATPFGEAGKDETAFWDSPAWLALMRNTVRWLVQR